MIRGLFLIIRPSLHHNTYQPHPWTQSLLSEHSVTQSIHLIMSISVLLVRHEILSNNKTRNTAAITTHSGTPDPADPFCCPPRLLVSVKHQGGPPPPTYRGVRSHVCRGTSRAIARRCRCCERWQDETKPFICEEGVGSPIECDAGVHGGRVERLFC